MKRFALAAAIAAVAASMAFSALPAAADDNTNDGDSATSTVGADDLTGMSTLGVDVSGVGSGASAVHAFLSRLSPDARHAVIGGCRTYLNAQEDAAPTVIPFCETAVHG